MSGFDGATASAPIEPVGWSSKIGFQVRPKSVVFQTPPLFGRHVEDVRLAGNAGDRHGAPAAKRADHAPAEFLVQGGIELLGGKKRDNSAEESERPSRESSKEVAFSR